MDLNPGCIIAWVVIGLVAGWLTGLAMKGGGFGFVVDLIVGLVGALTGGFLFSSSPVPVPGPGIASEV